MKPRQSGVALVLVLWVITLLSVIAGNFAFSMRGEAQIAHNLVASAQARALADAGLQRAWFELSKPPTDLLRWKANGVPHALAMNDAILQVSVQDEAGRIDLNTAPEALLHGLFKSAGLSEEASVALVDAVVDWRDPDSLRRLHGAEADDYRAAGKSYIPTNSPFETVDELQRVLGMSPDLYRKLAPALTVYSKQAGVNSALAPREVLLAIPGVNPALVEQYLAQRASLLAADQKALPFVGAASFEVASPSVPTYMARCEVKMPDGTVFVRQAIGRLAQEPKRPVTVLAWGEGESEQLTEKR